MNRYAEMLEAERLKQRERTHRIILWSVVAGFATLCAVVLIVTWLTTQQQVQESELNVGGVPQPTSVSSEVPVPAPTPTVKPAEDGAGRLAVTGRTANSVTISIMNIGAVRSPYTVTIITTDGSDLARQTTEVAGQGSGQVILNVDLERAYQISPHLVVVLTDPQGEQLDRVRLLNNT